VGEEKVEEGSLCAPNAALMIRKFVEKKYSSPLANCTTTLGADGHWNGGITLSSRTKMRRRRTWVRIEG
jgi:hypothetical protein